MKIPEPPGIRGKKAEHGPQKEKIYIYIYIYSLRFRLDTEPTDKGV